MSPAGSGSFRASVVGVEGWSRRMLIAVIGAGAIGACDDPPRGESDAWYARRASEVRELELLADVELVRYTAQEYAAVAAADAPSDLTLDRYAQSYGRLGFFPVDLDLRALFGATEVTTRGFYSPFDRRIVLVGDVSDSVIVHELVHALQDQHFDLAAYLSADTLDGQLARRAAVEGDAMLAEVRFFMQEDDRELGAFDWFGAFLTYREDSAEALASRDGPALFLDASSFAYSSGFEYAADNLTGVRLGRPPGRPPYDWRLENELFGERAPSTTQEVLGFGDADPPVEIGGSLLAPELAGRLLIDGSSALGEWYTYLLLLPLDGGAAVPDARDLASTWDGDRALFVTDTDTGARGIVWASQWQTAADAADLESALWELYGATPADGAVELGRAEDGEPTWIERRGNRVVAVKNVDEALAPTLAAGSFAE